MPTNETTKLATMNNSGRPCARNARRTEPDNNRASHADAAGALASNSDLVLDTSAETSPRQISGMVLASTSMATRSG